MAAGLRALLEEVRARLVEAREEGDRERREAGRLRGDLVDLDQMRESQLEQLRGVCQGLQERLDREFERGRGREEEFGELVTENARIMENLVEREKETLVVT